MGQFAQFGLNQFNGGQTHFSQLHISLDSDEIESLVKCLIQRKSKLQQKKQHEMLPKML